MGYKVSLSSGRENQAGEGVAGPERKHLRVTWNSCANFISSQCPMGRRMITAMKYRSLARKDAATFLLAALMVLLCLVFFRTYFSDDNHDIRGRDLKGMHHVLVTGGAGYIGSHAALRLLEDGHRVTIVDNLSRGNLGAVHMLQSLFPEPGRLQFVDADLGDSRAVQDRVDVVLHFAAVAYVGESVAEPLRYYHNITVNTVLLLNVMKAKNVTNLIYSSTCATYGEPNEMPITEETPQVPINPHGKAKKMAEDIIKDYAQTGKLAGTILRYFNVIGSDPNGRLGEAPRPELRSHGCISGACFYAALDLIPGLTVRGSNYETEDGTCVRDYIHVTDLVDAHVKAMSKLARKEVQVYNVGIGKGSFVLEFIEACKGATGQNITVLYEER